jgi:hypothetical protein
MSLRPRATCRKHDHTRAFTGPGLGSRRDAAIVPAPSIFSGETGSVAEGARVVPVPTRTGAFRTAARSTASGIARWARSAARAAGRHGTRQ